MDVGIRRSEEIMENDEAGTALETAPACLDRILKE
jgi:hypothetical protein